MDGVDAKVLPELLGLVGGAHQGSELELVPLGMFQEMRKYASTDITWKMLFGDRAPFDGRTSGASDEEINFVPSHN